MKSKPFIVLGLLLAIASWFAESAIHSFVFHAGAFTERLYSGSPNEIWMRSLIVTLFIGFGFIAQSLDDKRIKSEAKRGGEHFKNLVDHCPEAIGIHQNSRLIYANSAGLKLIGATKPDELIDQPLLSFVHPDYREAAGKRIHQAFAEGMTAYRVEEKLLRLNGEPFMAEVTSIPVEFEGSSAIMLLGRDIDERKRWENELEISVKKAESALKREQQHAMLLEKFFQHSHECIVLMDKNFNFIRVNKAYAEVCMRDINEFPGHNHFELYPSPLIEEFKKVVATGIPYHAAERPFVFPDHPEWGETYWDLSLVPIADTNGQIDVLLFTLNNVTDRYRAEFALIQTNRALRTISACNSMLIHAADESELLDGMCRLIVEYGGYCMAWVGYAQNDAQKSIKPLASAGHATEYLNSVHLNWADNEYGQGPSGTAIQTGKLAVVHNLKTAECSPWCDQALTCGYSSSIALPLLEGGKTFGALSIFANEPDIFKHEEELSLLKELAEDLSFGICKLRSEAAHQLIVNRLHESEERHRLVLDHAADAVLNVNPEGHFIYTNERAQKMLGYSADELLNMSISDITPPDEVEATLDIFEQSKVLGHFRAEIKQKCQDGTIIPVELNTVRLPDGNYYGSFRDIGERKRAEQEITGYVRLLEESMQGTLQAVSNMVEQRDPYTAGHERRVGIIAGDIAREMGWPDEKCGDLELIGLVHDLGKISTTAEILSKPGRLSPIEYELVKGHVEKGYEILKDVKFPLPIAEIIRQHHERMDGSGYPRGLKGEQILPEARILAVADVMESMSSHRPYRPALGIEFALKEITDHRGSSYDAIVVDALHRLVREKGYQLPT